MLAIASYGPSRQLAVVRHADLDAVGEARLGHPAARHAACGSERVMPTTRAPWRLAAWIGKLPNPQPMSSTRSPGSSASFVADQLELRLLRVLERLRAAREHRAAVGHRVVEEQREELGGRS